jgi:hypothetical protein
MGAINLSPECWIQTYTGRHFWPLNPRAEDVSIADIAHALGMKCRFNGHTREFYSVAEHCVVLANFLADDKEVARYALMHDAAEAYWPDVPRPIKQAVPILKEYENQIERAIFEKFGLEFPMPERIAATVKAADTRILLDERDRFLPNPPQEWDEDINGLEPLGVFLSGWPPHHAAKMWRHQSLVLGFDQAA